MSAQLTPGATQASRSGDLHWRTRIGRLCSALAVLFLLFDGMIKLLKIQPVVDSFARLGYADSVARGIGVLELACTLLYVVPRTSVFGAVLLTGLLGGAIASHLRVGDPWFTHVLFSLYIALPLWGGLYLRDGRVARLVPLRSG